MNPTKKVYLWRHIIVAAMMALAGLSLLACGKSGNGTSPGVTTQAFGLAARAQDGAITLSWPRISDAKKYHLYWSLTPGVTKSTGIKIANVTAPYQHAGLPNGVPFYYVVTVETSAGEGAESLEISIAPNATVSGVPGYLDGEGNGYLIALGQDGRVELYWSGVANATAYNVYRKTSRGDAFGDAILDATSPAAFTGLQNDKTYYFAVTAVVGGVESALSNEVVALPYAPETLVLTPGAVPKTPHHVYVYAGNEQTTIYLDEQEDLSDALRYTIYWNTSGNVTAADEHISNVVLPYTHTGLTNGTRYYYRIAAQNQHGDSDLAPMNSFSSVPNNDTIESIVKGLGDTNLQACITASAATSGWKYQRQLDWIECQNQKMIDLTGLEQFSNLYDFDLRQRDDVAATVKNLSVLAQLPNLYMLNLSGDGIVDLSFLSGLMNLAWLYLSDNNISDLTPLSTLTDLNALELSRNSISNIDPLAALMHLEVLYLGNNSAAYTAGNIGVLAQLPNLRELGLRNNGIVDLSLLSRLTNLTTLDLGENLVVNVSPLAAFRNLERLYLDDNLVSDLTPFAELLRLTVLWVGNNQILTLEPLRNLTGLMYLHFENNAIGNSGGNSGLTPLAEHTNLHELKFDNNQVASLEALQSLTQLRYLYAAGNQITEAHLADIQGLSQLEELVLDNNPSMGNISSLASLTSLLKLSLQNNAVVDVAPLSNLVKLTDLDLSGNLIVDVRALASLISLKDLDLSNNDIGGGGGDVGGLDALTTLTNAAFIRLSGHGTSLSCVELDVLVNGTSIIVGLGSPPVDLDGDTATTDTPTAGVNCI